MSELQRTFGVRLECVRCGRRTRDPAPAACPDCGSRVWDLVQLGAPEPEPRIRTFEPPDRIEELDREAEALEDLRRPAATDAARRTG